MQIKELYTKISNELVMDYTKGHMKVCVSDGNTKFSIGNGVPSIIYLTKDMDNFAIFSATNSEQNVEINIDLNSLYNYLTDTKSIWGRKQDIELVVRKDDVLKVDIKDISISDDKFMFII